MATEKTTLEVGDKIRIKNFIGSYVVEIARVTKTMAITKPMNDEGAVIRFQRKLWGGSTPIPVSRVSYDNTERTLLT